MEIITFINSHYAALGGICHPLMLGEAAIDLQVTGGHLSSTTDWSKRHKSVLNRL